jgi:thioredoxin reductase
MPQPPSNYDIIIAGGGPAGLSAALVLARCLRTVLVIDAGHPRNYASRGVHNFLTRDGIEPIALLRLGRAEVQACGGHVRQGVVESATCAEGGFDVRLKSGERLQCRKLLLATGVQDVLPQIPNLEAMYGLGVHHCPYCDGYEYRGQPIIAYGEGGAAVGLAENLRTWSENVAAVTAGRRLNAHESARAESLGIHVRQESVLRLEAMLGTDPSGQPVFGPPSQSVSVEHGVEAPNRFGRVVFEDGPPLQAAAFFFNTGQLHRSGLPFSLGCRKDDAGGVHTDDRQRTGIPGLYLAGDASRDVQFVVVAAAEGARAGVAINGDLREEDAGAHVARRGIPRTHPRTQSRPAP